MIPTTMQQRAIMIRLFIMAIACAAAFTACAQSTDDAAQWDHYLSIGTTFYFEGQSDSAKMYLEPVFENDANQKITAA